MVIIDVEEGYREAGTVAMRVPCAEVVTAVENVWNTCFPPQFGGFRPGPIVEIFVPRGTFQQF
jgi:hypothetical protein